MSLISTVAGKHSLAVRTALSAAALATAAVALAVGAATPVQAQYCEGTVHGLSAAMVNQLFNGDTVEITGKRGSWYFVGGDGFEGWAHRKWMRNSCG